MTAPDQPLCWSEGPFDEPTYNRLRGVFRDVPTDDMAGGGPLTSLETGTELGCVLDADGLAYCWGDGPLGIDGRYKSRAPVAVDTTGALAGKTLVDITAGESHACAVDDAGKAYCWGEDNFGEVGNGGGGPTQVPEAVKDGGVLDGEVLVEIEAGQFNTCALSDDGDVFCWGGWLGDGSGTTSQKPVRTDLSQIPGGETPASLHVAWDTPCLITDAGHAYCWGSSYQGQTGTGKVTGSVLRPTPVVRDGVLTGVELTDLVMPGNTSMCGLSTAGRIYCWGEDRYGVLGNGDFNGRSSVPVAVVDDGVLDGAVVTDLGASTSTVWAVVEQAP
jgi:alpha-tubulin suppressor-like RCC1 family protein